MRERGEGLGAVSSEDVKLVGEDKGAVTGEAPVKDRIIGPASGTAEGGKDGARLVVVEDEGKGSGQVVEHLVDRVRSPVAKGAVCLDHQHGLVGGLA